MLKSGSDPRSSAHAHPQFVTTHWSLVLQAGQPAGPNYRESLGTLCQTYWPPLYAYLRRRGYDASAAEDLVQGLFAHLLEREDIALADPQRGRFRSFLLTCLKHFVASAHDKDRAQKRGGGKAAVSLDISNAESRFAPQPADHWTPEREFERNWALTVLERVSARLREEMTLAGRSEQFERLRPSLAESFKHGQYGEAARALGMTEAAVRVAMHRMRKRYRELLRDEVAQTLADPADVDGEIRDLMAALGP